jgi:hypothetical protein
VELLKPAQVKRIFQFFATVALGDRSDDAQSEILNAGMTIIEQRGKDFVSDLLPVFEKSMATKSKTAEEDRVRLGVVVMLGTLARHLEKADARIPTITDTLIAALATPSEPVQAAVARCLPPLVQVTKERGTMGFQGQALKKSTTPPSPLRGERFFLPKD